MTRLAATHLLLQGIGVISWWMLLLAVPSARSPFTAAGAPDAVLMAFLLPDLVFVGAGSLVAAVGLLRARIGAWPVLLVHATAAVFAGLYCLTLPLWSGGSGWLAAVLMLPVAVVPAGIAWLLRPRTPIRTGS